MRVDLVVIARPRKRCTSILFIAVSFASFFFVNRLETIFPVGVLGYFYSVTVQ